MGVDVQQIGYLNKNLEYVNYVQPLDIVGRILRAKRYWLKGVPSVELVGKEGEFGSLRFDFVDSVINYRVYIKNRKKILRAAKFAIENFNDLAQHFMAL